MFFHPAANVFEDARGDVFFEELHPSGVTDLVAEVSANRGACGGEQNEQNPVGLLRGIDDEHDVGDAGDRQRDKGRVDDRDEKDAEDAEAGQEMEEPAGVMVRGGGQKKGEKVLRRIGCGCDGNCGAGKELHGQ